MQNVLESLQARLTFTTLTDPMIRSRRRNPRPVKDKRLRPAGQLIRNELSKLLDKDFKPIKKPKGGRSASSHVSTSQPEEGSQDLAISSSSAIKATNPLSPDLFETPFIGAAQSLAVGDQPLPPLTYDPNALDPSLLLQDFDGYNAPGPAPVPPASMYPDDLEGYGYQPYHPTQGTFDTNPETANGFAYTNTPLAEVWTAQGQHAVGPYSVQAPAMESAPAPAQPQTVKIWGPNKGWTSLNAVLDYSSQHSYLMASAAKKAGWHSFNPMAPEYSHQGSTQYGLVTPTHWINTLIKAEGFLGFPQRNENIYIFPKGQHCPANVDLIIGQKLWPDEAEGSTSAFDGLGF